MNEFTAQWRVFRFWNRLGIFLFLGFVPVLGCLAFALQWIGASGSSFLILIVAVPWFIFMGVAYFRVRMFPCPRCAKPFSVKYIGAANTRGRQCVHCGLKLYAEAQPGAAGDVPQAARL